MAATTRILSLSGCKYSSLPVTKALYSELSGAGIRDAETCLRKLLWLNMVILSPCSILNCFHDSFRLSFFCAVSALSLFVLVGPSHMEWTRQFLTANVIGQQTGA